MSKNLKDTTVNTIKKFDTRVFTDRIKTALEDSGRKQNEIANLLGVSAQTITSYKKGGKTPALNTVVELASLLGVSIDWLVGLSDEKTTGDNRAFNNLEDVVSCLEEIGKHLSMTTSIETIEVRNTCRTSIEDDPYIVLDLPTFRFHRYVPPLLDYFKKREKMSNLVEDGTIDEEMFDSWVKGEMDKLKDVIILDGKRFTISDRDMMKYFNPNEELPF